MTDHPHDPANDLTLSDYGWTPHFETARAGLGLADAVPVRVMAVHRDALDVAGPGFTGRIPQTLTPLGDEDRPTTGDWVAIDPATRRMLAIYPRTSLFKRRNAGTTARIQLIAANVDTVLFVTSANQDFNVPRLERYLALAHEARVAAVIVITKADLADDPLTFVGAAKALRGGTPVVTADARDPHVATRLGAWLGPGKTIALMGSSGVGKSTIINTLMGGAVQATQGTRASDGTGRHTTSGRTLHRLAMGAWLMDTPGMRELQIVDAGHGIDAVFDDIAALAGQCRFSDCKHGREPGCAIRAAIEAGTLEPARLERFEKLQTEDRRNSRQARSSRAKLGGAGKKAERAAAKLKPTAT